MMLSGSPPLFPVSFSELRVSHCRWWCVPSLVRRLWYRWFILNKLLLQVCSLVVTEKVKRCST